MADAPERIWAFYAPEIAEDQNGATIVAHEDVQHGSAPYIRANLVQRMVDEAVEKERERALSCLYNSPMSTGDGDDLLEQFDRICAAIRKGS